MTSGGSRVFRSVALLAWASLTLAVAFVPAAAAESPADWMYSPRTISEIDLTLPPASWQTLEEHPEDEYVPGTFSIAETNGTPGTAGPFTAPIEVGVRLKGNSLGSLRTLKQKAAFKIKFDEFVEGQTFLGLEKMTLNNMVEDASMVHEATAYEAFQALGVPSPHAGFTYLRVNGESFGLHLNLETLDKIALEKRFGPFLGPPQHLYEGEYGADVTPARVERFEVDEGKKSKKEDLEALVAAVGAPSPSFSSAVGPLTDLAEMTGMWAVEKYTGQWDGYSGRATEFQPNNYYLYSDASGRFQMLPWGTDGTWAERLGFEDPGGALFSGCVGDSECKVTYRQALSKALTMLNALDLDDSIRCTAERLKPWQELEAAQGSAVYPERVPFTAGQIATEVDSAREFAVDRPGELASFLAVSAPPAPPAQLCPPLTQRRDSEPEPEIAAGGGANANTTGALVVTAKPVSSLGLEKVVIGNRAARVRVLVPAAGMVTLQGSIKAPRGHLNACAPARLNVAAPATIELRCKLTDAVLRRLEKKPLRLHLAVDFRPSQGAVQEVEHGVTLRRR